MIFSGVEIISEIISENVDFMVKNNSGETPKDLLKNSIGGKLLLKFEQKQRHKFLYLNDHFHL